MRRTWMLLLVIALLAIFMAVPAMAATEHDHTGWSELTAGVINSSGNYTVPAGFTGGVTVKGEVTVTICLNGQTWDCSGGATRPLKAQDGATVTLCDCQAEAGTIKGADVGATLTGGSIYVGDNSEVSISDITITGGKAKEGGNIYGYTGSVLRFVSGLITLGETHTGSGGNIKAVGELYVGFEGGSLTDTVISKGKANESGSGGNVVFNNEFYMYSGHITEGDAGNAGGNLASDTKGVFRMSGGRIDLGICHGSNGHSQNFYGNNGATIYLSGGEIRGYVCHNGKTNKLYVSGSGSIVDAVTKPSEGKQDSYTGLRMADTGTIEFEDPAKYTGTLLLTYNACGTDGLLRIACNSDNYRDFVNLIENGQLTVNSTSRRLGANPTGVYQVVETKNNDGTYTPSALRMSCMCGYTKTGDDKPDYTSHNNDGHASWCDKLNTVWLPFTRTSSIGYFYLTADTNRSQIYNGAGNSIYAVDLNGYTLTNSAAGRRYRLIKGDTLSITDTSAAQTGVMEGAPAHGDQGGVIWLSSSTDANKPITVNIYAGTLRQSTTVTTKACYGGIIGGANGYANITMYGGEITGGHAFDDIAFDSLWNDANGDGKADGDEYTGSDSDKGAGTGGNLHLSKGFVFTMKGGTISNGIAVRGGNIYMNGGTFILDGGTIIGGTLDDTIYNADGSEYTGTIHTGSVDTTVITSGSSNVTTVAKAGSSVYVSSGTFTLKSGTITAGEVCLASGQTITIEDTFSAATPIELTLQSKNTTFTKGITSLARAEAVANYFSANRTVGIGNDYNLYGFTGEWGATVEDANLSYGLGVAIEKAAGKKLVTVNNNYPSSFGVNSDALVDLNGYTLSGEITVAEGKTLKLADSTAVDYKEGTGKVTGAIICNGEGENAGKVARTFTTGKNSPMGGNYRFLVLKDGNTYTSHRIYLAVKSTVLVPFFEEDTYIKYRTYFKCDATVAAKVTDYGAKVTNASSGASQNLSYVYDDDLKYEVLADDLNNLTIGMNKIFDNGKSEDIYSAKAYITIADDFAGEGNETVTSAASSEKTLKELVKAADGQWDTLSPAQSNAMKAMWNKFSTYMTGWELEESHYAN